jgi:hypothetical protein
MFLLQDLVEAFLLFNGRRRRREEAVMFFGLAGRVFVVIMIGSIVLVWVHGFLSFLPLWWWWFLFCCLVLVVVLASGKGRKQINGNGFLQIL